MSYISFDRAAKYFLHTLIHLSHPHRPDPEHCFNSNLLDGLGKASTNVDKMVADKGKSWWHVDTAILSHQALNGAMDGRC